MTDSTEPPPLTQFQMNQFLMLSALPTLAPALAPAESRLRWLEAEVAALKADVVHRAETVGSLLHRISLIREAAACEGVMLAELPSKIATLRADLAIAKTDLLLTQARVERFRAHVAALKAKFQGLNDAVEEACGELPEDWGVRVDLERGAATVWLIEPHGESEMVHEDETSISDLVREAVRRAKEGQR